MEATCTLDGLTQYASLPPIFSLPFALYPPVTSCVSAATPSTCTASSNGSIRRAPTGSAVPCAAETGNSRVADFLSWSDQAVPLLFFSHVHVFRQIAFALTSGRHCRVGGLARLCVPHPRTPGDRLAQSLLAPPSLLPSLQTLGSDIICISSGLAMSFCASFWNLGLVITENCGQEGGRQRRGGRKKKDRGEGEERREGRYKQV